MQHRESIRHRRMLTHSQNQMIVDVNRKVADVFRFRHSVICTCMCKWSRWGWQNSEDVLWIIVMAERIPRVSIIKIEYYYTTLPLDRAFQHQSSRVSLVKVKSGAYCPIHPIQLTYSNHENHNSKKYLLRFAELIWLTIVYRIKILLSGRLINL